MTVAYGTVGTVPTTTGTGTGTTSVTPGAPASLADGDYEIIIVQNKPDTVTPTTPTDWTLIGTVAGGSGASGNSTGASRVTMFGREKTAAWSAQPAITVTSGTSALAIAVRLTKTLGFWVDPVATSGADSTNGTGFSVTMAANPGITSGDFLFVYGGVGDDGSAWSAETITATGLTVGTVTERAEPKTTQGGDVGGALWTASPTAGTASAAPVVGATLSTSQSGPAILVRLRDTNTAPAQTVTPTAVASGETFPTPSGGNPRVAMVVDDLVGPNEAVGQPNANANDIIMRDILVADGMTVTYLSEADLPPSDTTTYDVVVHTESGSGASDAITAYPTMAVPLVFLETSWQSVLMATTGPATNPTSTTQYDIIDNAHAITTGKPDPLAWRTAASGNYGVATSELPSGATHLAAPSGNTSWATLAVAESGANLTTGTAPARRVVSGAGVGSAPAAWTSDMNALFISMVRWAANVSGGSGGVTVTQGGSNVTVSPTAVASAEALGTPVVTLQGATTLSPTAIASGESFASGGTAFGASQLFPGNHVMPESLGYDAPIMDSNGNLYVVTESSLNLESTGFQNQPRMMKSSDGGHTWAEVDAANRPGRGEPGIGDLESAWLTWSPTTKIATFTWQRSYVVWSGFRTSDHPTNPDTWIGNTRENVADEEGAPQFASHTSPSDQSYEWLFYASSGTVPYYKSRSGFGNYGTQTQIDSTGASPAAWLGNNNVSHIFYNKTTQLHYKTLSSSGTLQGTSTRIDTNGISTAVAISHMRPIPYMNSGTEHITAIFVNSTHDLKAVNITGGTPGSEETITTTDVKNDNPQVTGSQAYLITGDVDGTTVHAVWVDNATENILHSSRPHGGSWSTPDTLFTAGSEIVDYVYARVVTYPSGRKVLAYIYSTDFTADVVNVYYNELLISGGGGVTITQGEPSANLAPTGIASAEQMGIMTVGGSVITTPTAIATAEAFGTPVRTSTITSTPTAIATAEAFGTAVIGGTVSVSPPSIASVEAFGTAVVSAVITSSPTAIASLEAFGTPVRTSTISVSPSAIATAEALGSATVTPGTATLSPTGISSSESIGALVIGTGGSIMSPSPIGSGEAFGTLSITTGGTSVSPSAIASAQAFGTLAITGATSVSPTSITSTEAFGTVTRTSTITVTPSGIVTAESVSAVVVSTTISVTPTGITTSEVVGNLTINTTGAVTPDGIASAEAIGTLTITAGATSVSPTGVVTAENFGTASVTVFTGISPTGIASLEAFGTVFIDMEAITVFLFPTGIASEQAFGNTTVSFTGLAPPFVGWGIPI
jgi:hypothetical protein